MRARAEYPANVQFKHIARAIYLRFYTRNATRTNRTRRVVCSNLRRAGDDDAKPLLNLLQAPNFSCEVYVFMYESALVLSYVKKYILRKWLRWLTRACLSLFDFCDQIHVSHNTIYSIYRFSTQKRRQIAPDGHTHALVMYLTPFP